MIYKRLIGCIVIQSGLAVQSFGFERYLPIGKPEIIAENLDRWGVDEIVLLDIDATRLGRPPDYRMVERVANRIFTPLTVGGGVHELEHFQELLRSGADKVAVNTAVLDDPGLLTKAAERFGRQCLIASIDARKTSEGYVAHRKSPPADWTAPPAAETAVRAQEYGAGEILLNSTDRDGMRCGFDIELLKEVGERVSVPLIAIGGAGHPDHFAKALGVACVSAVGAANMLNHWEHSVTAIKGYLSHTGVQVRHGTHFDYRNEHFDEDGRLAKKSEDFLDDLGFVEVESEVI